ncbi:MAG: hypothetical protein K2W88_09440, partial [Pararheinheimera sp.]|nr:hypothetical protein [Rheinheimera sp.]
MDTTFIRELTASTIKGGVLNLEQGNIRSLSVFTQLQAPAQFLDETHLSPALASKLAWVDPSAVQTGGSIKKVVTSALATTAMGSFLSGGYAQTIKIAGSGPEFLVGKSIFGWIEVQMIRNGAVVMLNGEATQKLQVRSILASDEALPQNEQMWEWYVENEISSVVSAIASNTTASWSIKVVGVSSASIHGYFQISASVFEAYASTGGIIASTSWEKLTNKPTTAAGFGLTDVSLVGHTHSAADITSGTLATARGGTGRTDGKVTALATARTLTIGSTGKTFDGSANVSWTVAEIGAIAVGGAAGSLSGFNNPTAAATANTIAYRDAA